ncbi:MAG: hypothetical protein A2W07_06370 [candidate division Zixibacteria bacterium RBG_16_43_9]|nr:MAG: hypothetical protein A2W07_06370 [candidate division Zixibacteria bacterium RBG_16_43_9]
MTRQDLVKIVNYIVHQAQQAILENTDETDLPLDYMGIFTKDDTEFADLERLLMTLGTPGDKTATATGSTYLLKEPLDTAAGPLKVLKVRKPDHTRPQRGAPDFRVRNYLSFKEKYLSRGHNFSLIVRKEYEMMELKGVDVLVYFPSKTFDERQLLAG